MTSQTTSLNNARGIVYISSNDPLGGLVQLPLDKVVVDALVVDCKAARRVLPFQS